MSREYTLSFYFDSRRKKGKNTFPIKLRLYHPPSTKEKLFRTGYYFTVAEYNQAVKLSNAKGEKKISKVRKEEITEILHVLRSKAISILMELPEFSFDAFERRYYNKSAKLDICNYYEDYIKQLEHNKKIKTAEVYGLSLLRLKTYLEYSKKKLPEEIPFDLITPSFLEGYKSHYTDLGRTNATIGIYLRPLRTIFNQAINDPNSGVKKSLYPFGKRTAKKFQIPSGYKKKKALTKEQLKILFEAKPGNEYQKRAKAFWFFSYLANGMNIKDIALLTFNSINGNELSFDRAKTKTDQGTAKDEIKVVLPPFAKKVITEYGNQKGKKGDYIFPILTKNDTPLEESNKIKNFNRFIGQHIKKLAIANDLPSDISSYWARHSFATFAINHGNASMELVQESLGHKSIKTTQNYFAGFTTDVKKKLSESLLNFD
jgi:integrase/recombinase XerD